MNDLIYISKEIDRILKNGIEILPFSPIHEKLMKALNTIENYKQPICDHPTNMVVKRLFSNKCLNCGAILTK